ncbi:MAG: hypothetical protein AAFX58_15170, partial [Pseudomonadota bacterium]
MLAFAVTAAAAAGGQHRYQQLFRDQALTVTFALLFSLLLALLLIPMLAASGGRRGYRESE